MLKYLPLAGIVALMLLGGLFRPLVQLMRYGAPGVFLFRSGGTAQKVRDGLFVLLLAAYLVHTLGGPRRPRWVRLLVAEDGPLHASLEVAGALLITAGVLLSAAAQLNLGASWRIGIDAQAKPGMVSSGIYALCRHPIFLGFLMVFAGIAAMMPTPLSLFLLAGAYIGFRSQVAAEEAYMLQTYGEAYRDYARRVGRFVPGLGKL